VLGLRLLISIDIPDQDIARVHARVQADLPVAGSSPGGRGGNSAPAEVQNSAQSAVETLLEGLRGLGGEASAASVKVEVRCLIDIR
jgi:hypothetical protein